MLKWFLDFQSILFQPLAFSLQPFQLVSRADFRSVPRDWAVVGLVTGVDINNSKTSKRVELG